MDEGSNLPNYSRQILYARSKHRGDPVKSKVLSLQSAMNATKMRKGCLSVPMTDLLFSIVGIRCVPL